MNDEKTNEETVEELLESDLDATVEEDADTVRCRLDRARRAFTRAAGRSLQ